MAKSNATLDIEWEVNLTELFGREVESDQLKREIGREIITRIEARTVRGINKNGQQFPAYSKAYKKTTGKTSPVDLVISGKMLKNLRVTETTDDTITISWPEGQSKIRLRAENHIHGVTLPRRDFLGLPANELRSIAEEFFDEVDDG